MDKNDCGENSETDLGDTDNDDIEEPLHSSSSNSDISDSDSDAKVVCEKTSPRKRKRENPDLKFDFVKEINKSAQKINDTDVAFFNSVLPMVRRLNNHEKLLFRSKLNQELLDYQDKKTKPATRVAVDTEIFTGKKVKKTKLI